MKICRLCGLDKPLTDFWEQPRSPDGRFANCKGCERVRRSAYNAQPHVKDARRAATRRWVKRHPGRARAIEAARNPEALRARRAVSIAILRGKLQRQPCEVCGEKAQAHHTDYSKRLDVQWLCALHHKAVHMAAHA